MAEKEALNTTLGPWVSGQGRETSESEEARGVIRETLGELGGLPDPSSRDYIKKSKRADRYHFHSVCDLKLQVNLWDFLEILLYSP